MKLKEFLQPTWNKLILFIAIPFVFTTAEILLTFSVSGDISSIKLFIIPLTVVSRPISSLTAFILGPPSQSATSFVLFSFFGLLDTIYNYFLASFIVWIYGKVKKHEKTRKEV